MGTGSSKKKSSKNKYVPIQDAKEHGADKESCSRKRKKSMTKKGEKSQEPANQSGSSGPKVYSRSKSMPAEKPAALNKCLSTSLRFSDFCKIVRPERVESAEFKPVDVPYKVAEKIFEDSLCHICSVYTGSETYTCSVCYHVYHESCLVKIGQFQKAAVTYLHASASPAGWSCHLCNNVSNLLTNGEMTLLLAIFGRCNIEAGRDLTSEQFLSYRKLYSKDQLGTEMTSQELTDEFALFEKLSNNQTGQMAWTTFFNIEALKVLEKRNKRKYTLVNEDELSHAIKCRHTGENYALVHEDEYISLQNALVRKLTGPELQYARDMAALRDLSGEGEVTLDALRLLVTYHKQIFQIKGRQNSFFTESESQAVVGWEDFLRQMAIYLIASRLNVFRATVAEARQRADAEVMKQSNPAKSTSSVTITSKQPSRKGTSRSVYVINSTYGRLLVDTNSKGSKRPMSLA